MAAALAAFDRHLVAERGLSVHTVRAYSGDIASLLGYAGDQGCEALEDVDIGVLRGWLGSLHRSGQARATIARRAASARAFTAFAHQRGWLGVDPGAQLRTPKVHRQLPEVLAPEQMTAVLAVTRPVGRSGRAGAAADALGRAIELRDAAIMELLYATGIRVSELCGLDPGDLDLDRRTVRVLGKRSKERVVPVGIPAVQAVLTWLEHGRPVVLDARAAAAPPGSAAPARGRGPLGLTTRLGARGPLGLTTQFGQRGRGAWLGNGAFPRATGRPYRPADRPPRGPRADRGCPVGP